MLNNLRRCSANGSHSRSDFPGSSPPCSSLSPDSLTSKISLFSRASTPNPHWERKTSLLIRHKHSPLCLQCNIVSGSLPEFITSVTFRCEQNRFGYLRSAGGWHFIWYERHAGFMGFLRTGFFQAITVQRLNFWVFMAETDFYSFIQVVQTGAP